MDFKLRLILHVCFLFLFCVLICIVQRIDMDFIDVIIIITSWAATRGSLSNMKRLEPWKQSAIVLSCAQRMAETDLGRSVPF